MAGGKNIWENVIIFVLLGVVVCFLTPLIQGIFYKSKISFCYSIWAVKDFKFICY